MDNFKTPIVFILVSTVMTWALTKPQNQVSLEKVPASFWLVLCVKQTTREIDDSDFSAQEETDVLITEQEFRRRRPHRNFKSHHNVEKLVLKLGKEVGLKMVSQAHTGEITANGERLIDP